MSNISNISNISKMNENTTEYLNTILVTKLEDDIFESNLVSRRVRVSSTKKSETTKKLIDIVKPFFEEAGLVVNTDNGYIEYQSYKYNGPDFIDTDQDIGAENEEYEDVNSCFLVTHKDTKLKGGNVYLYETYPTLLQSIGYEKQEKTEVPLETGSVFMIKGDTLFKLNGCSGVGEMNIIHIVFYTKHRTGYQYDNDDDDE